MDIPNPIIQSGRDHFRQLIEGLNVITYEFSVTARRFTYVSKMAETITGYSFNEWLQPEFWTSHIHPADRKWAPAYSENRTFKLEDHEYEVRFICIDGSTKWFKDISTVYSEKGVPVKQVGVLIDISERKKYENDLKESKDKYQALIEQQTEMITRWKTDGTFTYVNDVFCDFFGKTKDQLLGKTFIPQMPVEDLERFSKFFMQLDKDNPVGHFTHRVIMPDGDIRWLRWTDTAIFDSNGKIIEYQTVGRDITARKKAEEALKQSEEKYRRLIENTNVIAWEYDIENKKYLYVSQQAERILGYSLAEWYKEKFWFEIVHPDDRQWAKKFSNTKIGMGESHEFEYRVIAKNGSVKWFRDITTVDKYRDNVLSIHGILIDITDRKVIEDKSKQNELQLSVLFENAPIGMALLTIDGILLKINNSFSKTLGYTNEELLGMNVCRLLHPQDINSDVLMMNESIKNGKLAYNLNNRFIHKSGNVIHASVHISVTTDSENKPHQVIAQVIDITEKKAAEEKLSETEFRLSTVINNLPNIIFYENHRGKPHIAENVENILGYTNKELSNVDFYISLIHPDDNAKIERGKVVWDSVKSKGYHKKEYRIKNKEGKYLWFEDLMYSVNSNNNNYIVGFLIDITERKEREEKLNLTQARLSAVLNNLSNVAIYEYGDEVNFISENIAGILGFSADDFMKDKDFFSKLILPEDIKKYDDAVINWIKNGSKGVHSSVIRVKDNKDNIKFLEDHMFEVKPDNGKKYFSGIMIDITEQKVTEDKYKETEARLSAILTNLPKVVIYQAMKGKDFVSDNIEDMIGYTSKEVLKEKYFFGKLMPEEDIQMVKRSLKNWHENEENVLVMEFRLKKKNGETVWIEDHMYRVKTDSGEPYISGILIDITERKLAEQKVSQSLKEKELLLKEIHHRVKNNLQVVSSLLKLQQNYVTDKKTYDVLVDSQNRVRSMALVHQKLYQSKDFSQIEFGEYVGQLTQQLVNVFRSKSNDVLINVETSNAMLSIDQAIPCGLIINELVSNSLKYAFPSGYAGIINIFVNNTGNESELIIQDNGIGFPSGVDFKDTATLGLQLVNTLVGQLDGTIEMDVKDGTIFTIKFKNSPV